MGALDMPVSSDRTAPSGPECELVHTLQKIRRCGRGPMRDYPERQDRLTERRQWVTFHALAEQMMTGRFSSLYPARASFLREAAFCPMARRSIAASILIAWLSFALIGPNAPQAFAQLAPTGEHYAGRA